jgi:hypothetical protein
MVIKNAQNFTLISNLLRNLQKGKTQKHQQYAKLEFVFFSTTNLQQFWAINFFWLHFFPFISTDFKSA